MRYSKLLIQMGVLAVLFVVAGCATSPFTGKAESADQIQSEFKTYQGCVATAIAEIKTDTTIKTNGIDAAVTDLEQRKTTISKLLGNLSGSTQASPDETTPSSNTPIAPAVASIFGVLGIALQADNRRKDGAIRTAKALNHAVKKKALPSGAAGGPSRGTVTTTKTPTSGAPGNAPV